MIDYATGSQNVERHDAPKLYAALENLCISRGITMPALKIIDSDSLNAFASGMREGQYSISVTRGLIDKLAPAELEAVLGHELTHIRNRDVQLMVVATIFAGIIAFVADVFVRNWDFPFGYSPRRSSKDDDSKGSGGAFIVIIIAIAVLLVSWGLSVLIRFAISRKREFLADAGSVELTKNPDAMIVALRKIEAHATIPDMPSRMSAFFIESPLARESDWMSTHPSMEARIDALVRYAGGRDPGPLAIPAEPPTGQATGAVPPPPPAPAGPWGPAPPQSKA
jgi:heat shock protein HtpX